MLTYPVQGSHFLSVDLDVMRQRGLKLSDLRKPDEFRGIDLELMNGFAKSLGVELEVHPNTGGWGALLPALIHGEGDLVACELTITPQREKIVAFSRPYISNWIAVVVRQDRKLGWVADLVGKKAALLSGSSHVEFLKQALPDVPITPTRFDLESLEAVEDGSADFTLVDTSVAPGDKIDSLHPTLKVAFRLRSIGDGIAVRQGSDLLAPLDAYLADLEKSGELQRIVERNGLGRQEAAPAPKH
jgi:ABC-type amino acid transport substrate-binding protein